MEKSVKNISRRKFILAGGAASIATIASMGLATDWALNNTEIDLDVLDVDKLSTDVLVIGGGMAGLFAAVKAHDAGVQTTI